MIKPWKLDEQEWEITERLRVAAWKSNDGTMKVSVEDRYLEDQPACMDLSEARKLAKQLEKAIAWAEKFGR